jgi:glycosyltransferase involved in cell wall biosynthesis
MADNQSYKPASCIIFSTADWDEPYWTNKQHCARSLAELGTKVLYIESIGLRKPNIGSTKDWRRLWYRFHKGLSSLICGATSKEAGIFVLSPLLIPGGFKNPLTKKINTFLLQCAINRSLSQQNFKQPLVWTYHPFMLEVIDNLQIGNSLIYHCVDSLAAVPGIDPQSFLSAEKKLLKRADAVFATSPNLTKHCLTHNPNTLFLSNVVDIDHFGLALEVGPIPIDLAAIPEPRLCYHGVLSDFKIDFQLLIDCARLKPEWSWVLIGEEREGQTNPHILELKKLPNVHFLGYKPYNQLPNYLRGMQVGLLPMKINDYTQSMFPMKYYEYLAAGLPVVSTPLDFALNSCLELLVANDQVGFVESIGCALSEGRISAAKIAFLVGDNTWNKRCRIMLNFLYEKNKNSEDAP